MAASTHHWETFFDKGTENKQTATRRPTPNGTEAILIPHLQPRIQKSEERGREREREREAEREREREREREAERKRERERESERASQRQGPLSPKHSHDVNVWERERGRKGLRERLETHSRSLLVNIISSHHLKKQRTWPGAD